MMKEEGSRDLDLLQEAEHTRAILRREPAVAEMGKEIISHAVLGQVLFALWDSGFYEYSRGRDEIEVESAVATLGYDGQIFGVLLDYLAGRGLLSKSSENRYRLSEQGQLLSNAFVRGLLTLYLGGYQSVLGRLGPLLRGEVALTDPSVQRSVAHAAFGTENITCATIVPHVVAALEERKIRGVIDLGCGTGGFLVQWAQLNGEATGVGIDASQAALHHARARARSQGVEARLTFAEGKVGTKPLPSVSPGQADCQAVTAMFLLHEFGREGKGKIVDVVASLKRSFPGRLFMFLEAPPSNPARSGASRDYIHLDYRLVHPLSRQGLPLQPEEWSDIVRSAGCERFESRLLGDLVYMYTTQF